MPTVDIVHALRTTRVGMSALQFPLSDAYLVQSGGCELCLLTIQDLMAPFRQSDQFNACSSWKLGCQASQDFGLAGYQCQGLLEASRIRVQA